MDKSKDLGFATKLLKQRWYPWVPQFLTFIVFAYILISLVVIPDADNNPGTVLTWLLWWPLVPVTFFLLGRFWCVLCPFGSSGDWLRKRFGLNRPTPRFIKKYGIWIINGLFFLVTWYEVAFGLTKSVWATAAVLFAVLVAALIFSLVYERRTWCRYLCFLGGIFGNYSQTAAIELRGAPEKCAACTDLHCFNGRDRIEGCALFISPKTLKSNRTCNLCGDCVKSCEKGSPQVSLRSRPGQELWYKREPKFDEAFLAASLVGIIMISTLGMLEIWPQIVSLADGPLAANKTAVVSLYLVILVGLAVLVYAIGSFFSSRIAKEKFLLNFSRFGYALIPLNLTTHVAHNLYHFFGEGRLILPALTSFGVRAAAGVSTAETVAAQGAHGGAALLAPPYIQALQFGLVGIGVLLSFYVARRIAAANNYHGDAELPHYVVIALFGFVAFWMFSLPMAMRH